MSTTYKTKLGDTFDSIAFNELGAVKYTEDLMEANPDYISTVIFSSGVALTLPDIEEEDTTASSTPSWA